MRREASPVILPKALLFDMDGTLTAPMLDFPLIKREMGIGTRPILEALAEMDLTERRVAEAILLRHEQRAAVESALNTGCRELLGWIQARGVRTALITRNSRLSVDTVLARHGLSLDVLVAREDAPPKPDPEPLRVACRQLGVTEAQAWMVGDGRYDVEAGTAAGIQTVWVSHGREKDFPAIPWRTVRDLCEFADLLAEARANP
jgi:HAD superfamily hydrolase (TIGR01509 family)